MGEFFNRIRDRVVNLYSGLDQKKKIIFFSGLATVAIVLAVVIVMLTRTEYVEIAAGFITSGSSEYYNKT